MRGAAILSAGLATAVVAGALCWARRNLVLVWIEGRSMMPTLLDGDRVLARRTRFASIRTGQLVLLAPAVLAAADWRSDAGRLWYIKRLLATPGEAVPQELVGIPSLGGLDTVPPDHLLVVGDNPAESYDSRQEGFIPQSRVRGVVVRRLRAGSAGVV